ncbi:hypothetical protein COY32_00705 [candidate division WWE3 bacterium CG_4_10_14_0_2_um_filter_41_14]|uniref:Uncharacterized protein n=1 Tax=candidate division WWE3 bacterium CG_4_10_14_0_2_um_filter_41_14 TaxID=1975072 RepID=A0A2M7TLN3_UNCKA|nr:MAG: hypothetical protein COY32_00705 [candidate division WWE3 bacterium CG_4_10_14_0_2_um_filter_41_14]
MANPFQWAIDATLRLIKESRPEEVGKIEELEIQQMREQIFPHTSGLPIPEKYVLMIFRYLFGRDGKGKKFNQTEIAREFNVTPSWVSQILKKYAVKRPPSQP